MKSRSLNLNKTLDLEDDSRSLNVTIKITNIKINENVGLRKCDDCFIKQFILCKIENCFFFQLVY